MKNADVVYCMVHDAVGIPFSLYCFPAETTHRLLLPATVNPFELNPPSDVRSTPLPRHKTNLRVWPAARELRIFIFFLYLCWDGVLGRGNLPDMP